MVENSPKNEADPTATLPRPKNAERNRKNIKMGLHRVVLAIAGCDLGHKNEMGVPRGAVWPISGCDLGQKNAGNLMEGVK